FTAPGSDGSINFVEPGSPDHNFTTSCEEFIGNTQMKDFDNIAVVATFKVPKTGESFPVGMPPDAPKAETSSVFEKVFRNPCSKILEDDIRSLIVTAWNAAHEPDPFASIRGDFDLSTATGTWKSKLQPLLKGVQCYFVKGAGNTPQWIYVCQFG